MRFAKIAGNINKIAIRAIWEWWILFLYSFFSRKARDGYLFLLSQLFGMMLRL